MIQLFAAQIVTWRLPE